MLQKIRTLLSFASRAGKIASGTEQVIKSVRMGKTYLVVMAEDVSNASKKKLKDKCKYYEVELIEIMQRDEISKCIGKINKTCVAINDSGFAESIMKYYVAMQEGNNKAK